jgi:hypothetical protein
VHFLHSFYKGTSDTLFKMKNRPAIYLLICILSFAQPASADEFGSMMGLMFRMMLSMMDAMSDVKDDDSSNFGWGDSGWGGANSFGLGMTTLPMMSGMGGMSPWSGLGGMPMNSMGMSPWSSPMMSNPWSNPFSGGYSPSMFPGYNNRAYGQPNYPYPAQYASHSLLNGRWFGNTGEILEVRGNQFRLRNKRSSISGIIRIENNIVNLFSPKTGGITQYTFARNQYELILQDALGQVLVFRQRPVNRGVRTF